MHMASLAAMYTPSEAAVRALEAGLDVLLTPSNPDMPLYQRRDGSYPQRTLDAISRGRERS